VLGDLTRTLGKIHQRRGVRVAGRSPPGLAFRGARQDLEEMLGNLLDNACKWARGEVEARAVADGDHLVIEVDDDGPGLPPEQHQTVLERGRRLDERVPGSGLGLAIVADLAELYSGRIELATAPRGGLRARLTLPSAATG
jgi:signal transduction histidine kinase